MTYGLTLAARIGRLFAGGKAAVLVVAAFCFVSAGRAAEPGTKAFDIPAGAAEKTLREYSAQSGIQALFPTESVRGVSTVAVKGEMTAKQALDRMLAGTPLVGVQDEATGSLTIVREESAEKAAKNVSGAIAQDSGRPDRKTRTEETPDGEKVIKLDTFEVFGQKTLNMDIRRTQNDAQPYIVFDREAISRSGAQSLEDLLSNRLTVSSNMDRTSQAADVSVSRTSINLRGLGPNQTLILIDGKRVAGSSLGTVLGQPNISGIPLAAIERIEVLPASASGVYGGSATGGVINVVLKRDFAGVALNVNYGNTFTGDTASRRIEFAAGFTTKGTQVMLNGSWANASDMQYGDRDLYSRGIAHILAVNPAGIVPGFSPPFGATANIRSSDGSNLILKPAFGGLSLNSPITSLPAGYAGTASDNGAGLLANAGKYNFELGNFTYFGGAKRTLYQSPAQKRIAAELRRQVAAGWDIYADVSFDETRSSGYAGLSNYSTITIPTASTTNPFQQNISVAVPPIGLDYETTNRIKSYQGSVGTIFRLPADWKAVFDISKSRTAMEDVTLLPQFNSGAATAAITAGSVDVLRDLNKYQVDLRPFVLPSGRYSPGIADLDSYSLRVGGNLPWFLGKHEMTLSGLVEYRRESFGETRLTQYSPFVANFNSLTPSRSQSISSAYLEANFPLISEHQNVPAVRQLALEIAGRVDRYTINGATSSFSLLDSNFTVTQPIVRLSRKTQSQDPSLSLRYVPIDGLMLRASYATGFLPPSTFQLVPTSSLGPISGTILIPGATDPLRGNEPLGLITFLQGGNPDLKPEVTESRSIGAVFEPKAIPELRLSVDWINITKHNEITTVTIGQPMYQAFLAYAPERLIRSAATGAYSVGPITTIDTRLINLSRTEYQFVDITLDYATTFGATKVRLNGRGTLTARNQYHFTPAAAVTDRADTSTAIRWREVVGLSAERGRFSLTWNARYFSGYYLSTAHTVAANQGSARVSGQIYHDLRVSWSNLQETGSSPLERLFGRTEVSLGVNNIFNVRPPIDTSSAATGYYSTLGDPRLATYTLALKREF